MDERLIGAVVMLVVVTVSPGRDMALVAKLVMSDGRRAAIVASLGICCGLPLHAAASALGIAAILATSSAAFTAVKLAGAAYLVFLGVRALAASRHPARPHATHVPIRARSAFAQGFVSNALDPKIAVFYLSVIPQFIDPAAPVLPQALLFAFGHAAIGMVWLASYSFALDRIRAAAAARVRTWLERVAGGVLIALGLRLALDRR